MIKGIEEAEGFDQDKDRSRYGGGENRLEEAGKLMEHSRHRRANCATIRHRQFG